MFSESTAAQNNKGDWETCTFHQTQNWDKYEVILTGAKDGAVTSQKRNSSNGEMIAVLKLFRASDPFFLLEIARRNYVLDMTSQQYKLKKSRK
jgi:hypothetical protein